MFESAQGHDGTVDAANVIKAWFYWLKDRRYEPFLTPDASVDEHSEVSPNDQYLLARGAIYCTNGPVQSVEFQSSRLGGDQDNEVRVRLECKWARRGIPGLHRLDMEAPGRWSLRCTGNDLGLGLVERLNADASLHGLWDGPKIYVIGRVGVDLDSNDGHAVAECDLVLTWNHVTFSPHQLWSAPPQGSWEALDHLISHLLAEPEWLPDESVQPPQVRSKASPLIAYARWSAWSLPSVGLFAGGIWIIKWQWFSVWPFLGGIVLAFGGLLALMASAAHFRKLRRGTSYLEGAVQRMWTVKREDLDVEYFYLWVEDLPFEVSDRVSRAV